MAMIYRGGFQRETVKGLFREPDHYCDDGFGDSLKAKSESDLEEYFNILQKKYRVYDRTTFYLKPGRWCTTGDTGQPEVRYASGVSPSAYRDVIKQKSGLISTVSK